LDDQEARVLMFERFVKPLRFRYEEPAEIMEKTRRAVENSEHTSLHPFARRGGLPVRPQGVDNQVSCHIFVTVSFKRER
jgi:hypothetical protein